MGHNPPPPPPPRSAQPTYWGGKRGPIPDDDAIHLAYHRELYAQDAISLAELERRIALVLAGKRAEVAPKIVAPPKPDDALRSVVPASRTP